METSVFPDDELDENVGPHFMDCMCTSVSFASSTNLRQKCSKMRLPAASPSNASLACLTVLVVLILILNGLLALSLMFVYSVYLIATYATHLIDLSTAAKLFSGLLETSRFS